VTACHESGNGKPACIEIDTLDSLRGAQRRNDADHGAFDAALGRILGEAAGSARDAHEARQMLARIEPAISRLVMLVGEPVPPSGLYGIVLRNVDGVIARHAPPSHVSLDSTIDYDVGDDTRANLQAYNMPAIAAKMMAERSRADRAEAALAERDRKSDRAMARDTLTVKKWQIIAGAVVAIATGGGVTLLARAFGG